jgi:hypothetical protein
MTNKNKSSYSAAVRILALVLTGLVASGVLVYLLTFLLNLFSGGNL